MPTTAAAAKSADKTIDAREIRDRIRKRLMGGSSERIRWEAKVGKYISGGPGAVPAFSQVLNRDFRAEALDLKPDDMAAVKLARDLITVVITWLRKNGWTVTV